MEVSAPSAGKIGVESAGAESRKQKTENRKLKQKRSKNLSKLGNLPESVSVAECVK